MICSEGNSDGRNSPLQQHIIANDCTLLHTIASVAYQCMPLHVISLQMIAHYCIPSQMSHTSACHYYMSAHIIAKEITASIAALQFEVRHPRATPARGACAIQSYARICNARYPPRHSCVECMCLSRRKRASLYDAIRVEYMTPERFTHHGEGI